MAFYLAALGHTLARDGCFEPVPHIEYPLRCRGQVRPDSRELVCEIFVEEVSGGPEPTLYATTSAPSTTSRPSIVHA